MLFRSVRDQYDNQASSWVSDTLTYSWILGASSSVSNPKTAGVLNASVLGSGVRTFSGGTYTTTGTGFNLYRSSETSRLRVQGTSTSTQSGSALSATLDFVPVPNSNTGYVLISDGASCAAGLGTSCGGSSTAPGRRATSADAGADRGNWPRRRAESSRASRRGSQPRWCTAPDFPQLSLFPSAHFRDFAL